MPGIPDGARVTTYSLIAARVGCGFVELDMSMFPNEQLPHSLEGVDLKPAYSDSGEIICESGAGCDKKYLNDDNILCCGSEKVKKLCCE